MLSAKSQWTPVDRTPTQVALTENRVLFPTLTKQKPCLCRVGQGAQTVDMAYNIKVSVKASGATASPRSFCERAGNRKPRE